MIGSPPNCRPECLSNSECSSHLACINQKCKDPCPRVCGNNAECRVISHTPMCYCSSGFTGDPFSQCLEIRQNYPVENTNPCSPSPCGANANCREQNGAGACTCIQDYTGNPYEGCRPECVLNSDCPSNLACLNSKCKDPCPGTCGRNAMCQVVNHLPSCTCFTGYTGDPFRQCSIIQNERKNSVFSEIRFLSLSSIISITFPLFLITNINPKYNFIFINSKHISSFSCHSCIRKSLSTLTLWSKFSMS